MKNLVLVLFFNLVGNSFAFECVTSHRDIFEDLNNVTIPDSLIVTEEDRLFCPEQALKHHNISPTDLPDDGSVWRVGNRRWNDDWEIKYQHWVKENVTPDLFVELDFPTDCADAVLSIRAIFARLHYLPVSFLGTTFMQTSKAYSKYPSVTHWSEESWKEDFKKDERFRTALHDWNQKTGTATLSQDTYQIELTDKKSGTASSCVSPGTLFLEDGHVEVLNYNKNSMTNPYQYLSSTVPSEVRNLEMRTMDSLEVSSIHNGGYLWWNWTINCKGKFIKVADENMPYYSSEQSLAINEKEAAFEEINLNEIYRENLFMGKEQEEILAMLENEIYYQIDQQVEPLINSRQKIVSSGLEVYSDLGVFTALDSFHPTTADGRYIAETGVILESSKILPAPEERLTSHLVELRDYLKEGFVALDGDKERLYDTWSTPSRDKRLEDRFGRLGQSVRDAKDVMFEMGISHEDVEKFNQNIDERLLDKKIELKNGKKISYYHLINYISWLSSQPWDSEELRWGGAEMSSVKSLFYTTNKDIIEKYEGLIQSTEPNAKLELEKFKKEHHFILKEKTVIDEYFFEGN